MPEPCKFLSLVSFQMRILWTHKEVDLSPHSLIGLVLQEGDTDTFLHVLGFESLAPFSRVSKQGPCFTAVMEDDSSVDRTVYSKN